MAVNPGNGGERDRRLDLVYRDTPREPPPPHLDAAILAAARREVGARPRPLSAQVRRWRVPVSIAALVVLSVSLVTLVREEGGESLLRDAPSPPVAPAAQTAESPAQPAEDRHRAPAAAPEPFSARRDETPAKAAAEPRGAEREARSAAGPAVEQSRNATPGAEADVKSRESAPRPSVDQAKAPPISGQRTAPEAAASAGASAPPVARRLQAEPSLAMKRAPVWQGLEHEPPGKWLERLTELKKQGRTQEAAELLAEIRRRFPDQPLPDGLE